jgi:hypothetical protein
MAEVSFLFANLNFFNASLTGTGISTVRVDCRRQLKMSRLGRAYHVGDVPRVEMVDLLRLQSMAVDLCATRYDATAVPDSKHMTCRRVGVSGVVPGLFDTRLVALCRNHHPPHLGSLFTLPPKPIASTHTSTYLDL